MFNSGIFRFIRINSLFWKIFLAFWLASMLVMVATTYVVIEMSELTRHKERHREYIERIAGFIVGEYEQEGSRTVRPPLFMAREFRRIRSLTILDPYGEVIFSRGHGPKNERSELRITIVGDSGKSYTAITRQIRAPRFVMDAIHRLNYLRFVLISVASGLVSLLLTWMITRPLKKLGVLSQKFSHGDLQTRVDEKLLNRGDEIGDLAREFNLMAENISHSIELQQQLLHDVSHELRAPLARLQAAAALVEQHHAASDPEVTQRIDMECQRMDSLIQQILDYSRLQESPLSPEKVDLVQLLEALVEDVRYEYEARPIRFNKPQKQLVTYADPDLLRRALENILRNACKHTPPQTPVEVELLETPKEINIFIRDEGPGVSAEEENILTTPFYRGGNIMHADGFGLGLSIAKRAIEKHSGVLIISNRKQGGLEVTIRLPVGHPPKSSGRVSRTPSSGSPN